MSETEKPKKINRKVVVYGFFTIILISVLSLFWSLGSDLGAEKERQEEILKAEEARLSAMTKAEPDPEARARDAFKEAQEKAARDGGGVASPLPDGGNLPPPPGMDFKERESIALRIAELERSRNEVNRTTPSDRQRSNFGLSSENFDSASAPDPSRGGARTGFVMYAADPEGQDRRLSLKMQETVEREKRERAEAENLERKRQNMAKGSGLLYENNDKVEQRQTNIALKVTGTHWLAAGTVVRAVLVNGIDTSSPGVVTARVIENVFDSRYGSYLVIPAGSVLVGTYSGNVNYYQERIAMQFQTLTTPAGASVVLQSTVGADKMGVAGVPGELHTHLGKRIFATALAAVGVELMNRNATKNQSTVTQGGMTSTTNQSPAVDIVAGMAKKEIERFAGEPMKMTAEAGALLTITLTDNIEIPPVANRR